MAEKERVVFFTEEELGRLDGMMLETNGEIMKQAGRICGILEKQNSAYSSLRDKYSLTVKALKESEDLLEREMKAKEEWMDECNALQEKNRNLEKAKENLETKLNEVSQEKEELENRIDQLFQEEKHYQTLTEGLEQIRKECNQHYTDAKNDRDKANSELKRCQESLAEEIEKAKQLRTALDRETGQRKEKEKEAEELRSQLPAKDREIAALKETNRQYSSQRQKMPALMRLYDAYNAIMEKREEFPHGFSECLQKTIPMDDFDCFVSGALRRNFPIACYLSLKSFLAASFSGQVSEEAAKKALCCADQLLEEVFAFGSEYFKEEKLFRLQAEKGESFDDDLCTYVNGRGGMYGDITDVWIHGLRDEKEDKIYHSYVEGE